MKKRLLKVAITTALTVAFAVPAFANPFSDVPVKHWAYDAVNKLAQAGIVDGYGDGTFRGEKTMTRYEMAQIVAKAMNKSLNNDQKAIIGQLSKEFAVELNNLGVKVEGMQKQLDKMVKVSGDARVRYFNVEDAKDYTDYRARVAFDGKINENLKFNARLSSGSLSAEGTAGNVALDTANVSFSGFGFDNTVGRQDIKLGSGYLADTQMNGLSTKIGGLKLFGGNMSQNAKDSKGWARTYGAEYSADIMGAKFTADYLKVNDNGVAGNDDEIYGASLGFNVAPGLAANAEFFKNSETDATAAAYGLKLTKVGLSATYRDVEAGAFTRYSGMIAPAAFYGDMGTNGFKGMEYQYDHNLGKNAVFTAKYQDFEGQNGEEIKARTSAMVNVKF